MRGDGHRAAGGTYTEDNMREFLTIYSLYRWHGRWYALRTAWRIAVRGVPF